MVEKIKSEGLSPSVLITAEVKVALRQFFLVDSRERMAFLHGEIEEDRMVITVRDITIPPQVSGAASVEIDIDYDPTKYFAYHDEFKARHDKHPFIGQAHSFTGGAHHSTRDDNTDSLLATDGAVSGGRSMYVSITASSTTSGNDFRCDVIVTPPGMPQYNIVHEDVDWSFLANSKDVADMLVGAEDRVSHTVYKAAAPTAPGIKPVKGKKEKASNYEKRLKVWEKRKTAWDSYKPDKPTKGDDSKN